MKKCVFIIPYFGRFNNYFQLFLNSCGKNPEFDWYIITDDSRDFSYPKNVKVIYMTFDNMKAYIQNKFDFKINIDSAHKLCDFKPCYGYIFGDIVRGYDYWGYCDCDLIFGNLRKFINSKTLDNCDKFGVLGHLSLIKNVDENNEIFKKKDNYKEILSSPRTFAFDEVYDGSINSVFKENKKRIIRFSCFADIYTKSSSFRMTHFIGNTLRDFKTEKKKKRLFIWDDGKLMCFSQKGRALCKKELSYIHLQKRKMDVKLDNEKTFKIIPNSFESLEKPLENIKCFDGITLGHVNVHCLIIRLKNLRNKIKESIKW